MDKKEKLLQLGDQLICFYDPSTRSHKHLNVSRCCLAKHSTFFHNYFLRKDLSLICTLLQPHTTTTRNPTLIYKLDKDYHHCIERLYHILVERTAEIETGITITTVDLDTFKTAILLGTDIFSYYIDDLRKHFKNLNEFISGLDRLTYQPILYRYEEALSEILPLKYTSITYVMEHKEKFLRFPLGSIEYILQNPSFRTDEENSMFTLLFMWIGFDRSREVYLQRLGDYIVMTRLTNYYLLEVAKMEIDRINNLAVKEYWLKKYGDALEFKLKSYHYNQGYRKYEPKDFECRYRIGESKSYIALHFGLQFELMISCSDRNKINGVCVWSCVFLSHYIDRLRTYKISINGRNISLSNGTEYHFPLTHPIPPGAVEIPIIISANPTEV